MSYQLGEQESLVRQLGRKRAAQVPSIRYEEPKARDRVAEVKALLQQLKQDCGDSPSELHMQAGDGHAVCAAVGERPGFHLGRSLEWRLIVREDDGWKIVIRQPTIDCAIAVAMEMVDEHERATLRWD